MDENKAEVIEQIPKIIEDALKGMSSKLEEMLSQIQSGAEAMEKNSLILLNQYKNSFDKTN